MINMTDHENSILWNEYFYPGTNILINNYDIKDYEKLKKEEASNAFDRLLELRSNPLDLGCGLNHLKELHRYIFGDVYPFAGKYRKVNMEKELGSFLFIDSPNDIELYLNELFADIERQLNSCSNKHDFCEIMAKLYTQLIYCHPFREGNGRTTREFLREFSIQKSKELGLGEMELEWRLIDKEELNHYIEVAHIFPGQTASLFYEALISKDRAKNI